MGVNNATRTMIFRKGKEVFVFRFAENYELMLILYLMDWVRNETFQFDAHDLAVVTGNLVDEVVDEYFRKIR